MKFLITRCTTYDMAGMAMIQGAALGLKILYPGAEFAALVFHKDHRERPDDEYPKLRQFIDPEQRGDALHWADCCLDIGGLCKGVDPYRLEYIETCRMRDIPYIYMAVSFEHPDPLIVKDIPATARGYHSCCEYAAATGSNATVVPDLSFMLKPKKLHEQLFKACYTTHAGKPWQCWGDQCHDGDKDTMIQAVFKPKNDIAVWEPPLPIPQFTGLPAELFGLIGQAEVVYTCRYHAAVAAVMQDVPYVLPPGMPNPNKYHDLEYWKGLSATTLADEAMYSCYLVKEVLHG